MTFRGAANIDPNQHKGLVISNSITNNTLVPTGLSLTNAQPMHVAIVDGSGTQITTFGGGTQYTDGGTPPANPVGPTLIWNEGGTWRTVSTAKPLPVTASFSPSGTQDVNLTKVAGSAVALGQTTMSASIPVTIASNQASFPVTLTSTTITGTVAATQSGTWNIGTVTAVTAITNALPVGANVIGKVSIDQTTPGTTNLVALTAETTKVIGTVRNADGAGNLWTSNSTTFTAKFAQDSNLLGTLGTAFSTAGKVDIKGADGDVFVRQTTAANLKAQVVSGDATGSAVPANAYYNGGNATTALPTAATAGNLTGATYDKFGRQVTLNNAIRDIMGTQTTTISSSTSETTIITAVASTFLDLVSIFISNTSATAARVDIRDTTAGSIIFQLYVPAGDMRGISLATPWPQSSVNTNWTAQSSASVADLRVSALYIKNK